MENPSLYKAQNNTSFCAAVKGVCAFITRVCVRVYQPPTKYIHRAEGAAKNMTPTTKNKLFKRNLRTRDSHVIKLSIETSAPIKTSK